MVDGYGRWTEAQLQDVYTRALGPVLLLVAGLWLLFAWFRWSFAGLWGRWRTGSGDAAGGG